MTEGAIGKRIIVVGCPGSGKSTLSRRLHELTGIPLFHLDNVWWKPDRTHISREEFDARLAVIMQGQRWIIDGDYSRTYEPRFAACDTVIFLDFSEEECLRGIQQRTGTIRPDIPWSEDEPDPELVKEVKAYRTENRPVVYGLIEKYPDRNYLIFTGRDEAQNWLSGLTSGKGTENGS